MSGGEVEKGRGRARSRTYSDNDMDFQNELSEASGVLPPPVQVPPSGSLSVKAPGGLSHKTIQTLTRLDVALAPPKVEGVDDDEISSGGSALDEEAMEEAALAEQERRKREGTADVGAGQGGVAMGAAKGRNRLLPDTSASYDVQVKMLVLGDSGVGKSSLMTRFSENKFSKETISTAGVDFKTANMEIEGKRVKCQIWDTAGQEKFRVITHSYYKSAQGIILVYDVSEPSEASFNNVKHWMENIHKHASPTTRKLLVGNKIDVKGKRISRERGQAIADQYGMHFMETSAKEGTNVKEGFGWLARDVIEHMFSQGLLDATGGNGAGATVDGGTGGKKKDCCIT